MDYFKDIPNITERIFKVLEIYEYDVSTTRKRNKNYSIVMWKIRRFIDKHYSPNVPIENGDILDWAIGNINFSH